MSSSGSAWLAHSVLRSLETVRKFTCEAYWIVSDCVRSPSKHRDRTRAVTCFLIYLDTVHIQ